MTIDRNADLRRVPGLFRRWELAQLLEPGEDYHLEDAGTTSGGGGRMRTGTAPAALWAPMRTEADLRAWVIEAMPGDVVEYHLGFLARDRHLSPENRRISRVADAALGLSDKKLVHLVQKRVGRGRFSYLAVRRAR